MPIIRFIFIGIIWGVVPVSAQLRNYPSWEEYWRDGTPCLLFLSGFSGSFLMSLYIHHLDSKKAREQAPKPIQCSELKLEKKSLL